MINSEICPLRPILETERTIEDGILKLTRWFLCPVPSCSVRCYQHRQYQRHLSVSHTCEVCYLIYPSVPDHICPLQQVGYGSSESGEITSGMFRLNQSVYRGIMMSFTTEFLNIILMSMADTFEYCYNDLELIITQCIHRFHAVRATISVNVTLEKMDGSKQRPVTLFAPFQRYYNPSYNLSLIMSNCDYLITTLNMYHEDSSGYRLVSVNSMQLRVAKYQPIRPNGYQPHSSSISSRYVTNIKTDTNCFAYCILTALKRDDIRIQKEPNITWATASKLQKRKLKRLYQRADTYHSILQNVNKTLELNFDSMLGAPDLMNIDVFEVNNPNISVNIYRQESNNLFPHRITTKAREKHIDLLLLKKPILSDTELPPESSDIEFEYHLVYIDNLAGLTGHRGYNRRQLCPYCLKPVSDKLEEHTLICGSNNGKCYTVPKDTNYKFTKLKMYEDIPYKIFFSFQYYPIDTNITSTDPIKMEVQSYAILLLGPVDKNKNKIITSNFYAGEEPVHHFLDVVCALIAKIDIIVKSNIVPIIMSHRDKLSFQLAMNCAICKSKWAPDKIKCADHCHFTGLYRQALCQGCNGSVRIESKPVIIGHGISARELHTILKNLTTDTVTKANVILKNAEEIISLSIDGSRFFDTKFFLNTNLDKLVHRLKGVHSTDDYSKVFPIFYEGFRRSRFSEYEKKEVDNLLYPNGTFDQLQLFILGVWYPSVYYDQLTTHFECIKYLTDPIVVEPPDYEEYYSASRMFYDFKCQNMLEFSELMATNNLHLLADVTISFVNYAMKHFLLSPAHSSTLASFSYDICFSSLTDGFEYMKDISMINFLKLGLRGGAQIGACRLLQSNNERLRNFNGQSKERSHILSVDMNNMYAEVLSANLGFSDFEWLTDLELQKLDVSSLSANDEIGYFLMCDIHYPKTIHDRDVQMPYAISKRQIHKSELSYDQQQMWEKAYENTNKEYTSDRLVLDLTDKVDYVCYGSTLAFYVARGLQITKLTKGIKFKHKPFLRDFFTKILKLREEAQREYDEVNALFLKGILVRVFGCMMQDNEHHVNTIVCVSRADAIHHLSKHNFVDYTVLNEVAGITLFHFRKNKCLYNRPIIASMIALDKSKELLYLGFEFFCSTFAGAKLGMGDTDGLTFEIPDPDNDYFSKLKSISSHLDLSTLNPCSSLFDKTNMGKAGKWKVVQINALEVCSILPKLFSIKVFCDRCYDQADITCPCSLHKRASGVPTVALRKIHHEVFKQCILEDVSTEIISNSIRSVKHQLMLVKSKQIGFSSINPSRRLLLDRIHSVPLGYRGTRHSNELELLMELDTETG